MSIRPTPHLFAAVALGASVIVGLSGCSVAPWKEVSTPNPVTTTLAPVLAIVNELSAGSAKHSLPAGAVTLEANYWSTLSMDKWTASANKPINFSIMGTLGTDDGQSVYLSKVSMVTAVSGPLGPLGGPPAYSDTASISPGYLVKSPYSYSQNFVLPAVDPTATSITLSLTYELLIQTTPGSTEYAKQTASDQITIAIAP